MALVSPRFQDPRIQQAAADKHHPIEHGEPTGYPVAAIQYSLVQLGDPMPKTMKDGYPDGAFGSETVGAMIAFQHRNHLKEDAKAGPNTLATLDKQIATLPLSGGPVPGPWPAPSVAAPPVAAPAALPPAYASLPKPLLATLRQSYEDKKPDNVDLANAMGWPPGAKTSKDMTFAQVLDSLNRSGLLAVIEAIYKRCTRTPGLWDKIFAIRNIWDYRAGNYVSEGMVWTSHDADGAMSLLRISPNFCEDIWPMNADHQKDSAGRVCLRTTFREIVPSGTEGLHVCVVRRGYRAQDKWGGEHDIHIDRHQIGCLKYHANPYLVLQAPNGSCFYKGIVKHAKDAIPYFLKKFGLEKKLEPLINGVSALADKAGGIERLDSAKVADIFTQMFPVMPRLVAEQAAQWLIETMKEITSTLSE